MIASGLAGCVCVLECKCCRVSCAQAYTLWRVHTRVCAVGEPRSCVLVFSLARAQECVSRAMAHAFRVFYLHISLASVYDSNTIDTSVCEPRCVALISVLARAHESAAREIKPRCMFHSLFVLAARFQHIRYIRRYTALIGHRMYYK